MDHQVVFFREKYFVLLGRAHFGIARGRKSDLETGGQPARDALRRVSCGAAFQLTGVMGGAIRVVLPASDENTPSADYVAFS